MGSALDGPYNILRTDTRERVARIGVKSTPNAGAQVAASWGDEHYGCRRFADTAFEALESGSIAFSYRGEQFTLEKDNS